MNGREGQKALTWAQQWRLFIQFCRHPYLNPRVRQISTGAGWYRDWVAGPIWMDALKWATTLWIINLFVIGPLVLMVATKSGATHAINPKALPWFLAIFWAPFFEEMLFRYGLRRPATIIWLLPLLVLGIWQGAGWVQVMLFVMALFLVFRTAKQTVMPSPRARRWLRMYRAQFWWIFHLATLLFAAVHLSNFTFSSVQWWMLPALVLPQWVTGLVLGWFRVMKGIGPAILLHSLFNAGPMVLVWWMMRSMPDLS